MPKTLTAPQSSSTRLRRTDCSRMAMAGSYSTSASSSRHVVAVAVAVDHDDRSFVIHLSHIASIHRSQALPLAQHRCNIAHCAR